eukprot:1177609-Prorocentrum_minimum.AAC.2
MLLATAMLAMSSGCCVAKVFWKAAKRSRSSSALVSDRAGMGPLVWKPPPPPDDDWARSPEEVSSSPEPPSM